MSQSWTRCILGSNCEVFTPMCRWTKGRVALLGDSAHAMQPNLGQGGCMAIEDGYQLAADLASAIEKAPDGNYNLEEVLKVRLLSHMASAAHILIQKGRWRHSYLH